MGAILADGGRGRQAAAGAVLAALLLAGCSGGPQSPAPPTGSAAGSATPSGGDTGSGSPAPSGAAPSDDTVRSARVAGVVAGGLEVPWGMTFLPDGSALVAERDSARVKHVDPRGEVRDVGRVRGVSGRGEGGLLGLALSPTYESDRLLFAYFTAGEENRIDRMTYDGRRLGAQRRVLGGIPAAGVHDGGRIAFGPDGYLYVGTGDAGRSEQAQDRGALGGKILRITPDGRPAPGNPFPGSPVYSLGHRNVQGLAWDSRGQLWAAEFGQNRWDELNRIEAGANYGWPQVEGREGGGGRYVDPVAQWPTDEASPSGIAVAGNAVYLAALRGARLWQVPIPGGRPGRPRALLTGDYGRLRTVTAAPDGSLWLSTSNRDGRGSPRRGDDRILRLTLS
jgi:glucose/arabinose dehydrogenase